MMKKTIPLLSLLIASLSVAAQTTITEKIYPLPKCDKPVASVVVGKLVCKSAGCKDNQPAQSNSGLGVLVELARMSNQEEGTPTSSSFPGAAEGMSSMLTTMLKQTGCFDIQEREALDELAKELALVGKKLEVQQADFMISGSITSMNMTTEKTSFGAGFIPVIGSVGVTTKKADVGLDIKVIDVNKARVLDAKTFTANNETSSTRLGGGGLIGGALLGGSLSNVKGTPMEPVLRDILTQVASYSANKLVATNNPALAATAEPVNSSGL